MKMVVV